MTKLEKVLIEQLSKMTSIDFGAIIAAAADEVMAQGAILPGDFSGSCGYKGEDARDGAMVQWETQLKANPGPKAEAPKAEAPKAEAPKAEAPKAEAPKAEAPRAETQNVKPAPRSVACSNAGVWAKREAPKTEASAPKAASSVAKPVAKPADKPAAGNVVTAFLEGDKAARGAIVSLATLAQLREINDSAKIGFDLSKYDEDSLAVARNKVMRWVNKQ